MSSAPLNARSDAILNARAIDRECDGAPSRASPLPSTIDLAQIVWLGNELEHEGLPGLMAIAADDGAFAFVLAGPRSRAP